MSSDQLHKRNKRIRGQVQAARDKREQSSGASSTDRTCTRWNFRRSDKSTAASWTTNPCCAHARDNRRARKGEATLGAFVGLCRVENCRTRVWVCATQVEATPMVLERRTIKPATCTTEPKTMCAHKLWVKHARKHANGLNTTARMNFWHVHQQESMQASMQANKQGSKLTSKTATKHASTHTQWHTPATLSDTQK